MSKHNFQPPVQSNASVNSFTPLTESSPRAENNYHSVSQNSGAVTERKSGGAVTEYALSTTDLEIYGIAAVNLLQQNNFGGALKLLDTGYKQINVNAGAKPGTLDEALEAMIKKLWLSDQLQAPSLALQIDLVKQGLLNPLDRDICFTAVGALADLYAQTDREDLCESLSTAFLEILTTIR